MSINFLISQKYGLKQASVHSVMRLLDEGATVPFISRYRKEATGGLDEVAIGDIKKEYEKLTELEQRKATILETIAAQGALTDRLREKIISCYDPAVVEDIYLPFKPKRRTRATIAREKGLEPLAALIMRQDAGDPARLAQRFVTGEVTDTDQALAGASDIIAEWVSESERSRSAMRHIFSREATLTSKVVKGKQDQAAKYSDYHDYSGPLSRVPSHRLLAMSRGEKEGLLRVAAMPDENRALEQLQKIFLWGGTPSGALILSAIKEGYKRLLGPSMETEALGEARAKAQAEAIAIFAVNLRQLLLFPPLPGRNILAIDPGFRTGCKIVCLDRKGDPVHYETIYPHPPAGKKREAIETVRHLQEKYDIEAIAVGNGTAGRETEEMLRDAGMEVPVISVSEDGASVYSASATAREEFPNLDVTVRGAVSIGRRLADPLAELVKIDPKSIGVGQYQHDVDQAALRKALDGVVTSCVNSVGVNLNTASVQLLSYVSGLGPSLASKIVAHRAQNGPFRSRRELHSVPRLGAKAFEQCAGFLRIPGGDNPLDNTAVHPESYHIVERMARDHQVSVEQLINDKQLRGKIDISGYADDKTGIPTLRDIMEELNRPGRDPRGVLEPTAYDPAVKCIGDLREGMTLDGKVTNVTGFGAFIDLGIKEQGLIHISHMSDRYVSDPAQVVRLGQQVKVKVLAVDPERRRISLTMKGVTQ